MRKYLELFKRLVFLVIILLSFSPRLLAEGNGNVANGANGYVAEGSEVLDIEDVLGEDSLTRTSHIDLTTMVPEEMEVIISGSGTIVNGGKIYGSSCTIRTTDTAFRLSPNTGYQIASIYWNSVDITSTVVNGVLNLSGLDGGVLEVEFTKINSEEEHGELDPHGSEGESSESESLENTDEDVKESKQRGESNRQKSLHKKTTSPVFNKTADNFEMVFVFAFIWLFSLIVFVVTLIDDEFGSSADRGCRYKKNKRRNRYRRLKN